jgi:REP element-mobilizing transposase RayT
MANTYSQIYVHVVFAVQGRQRLVPKIHKEELHKYITGIIRNQGQKLLAIHCMPDHAHILLGLKPSMGLSDLVQVVKADSTNFINSWQEGYGAFSCGHSQLATVIRYIQNQEQHHEARSFGSEYIAFLRRFQVEYDPKYLFDFADDETAN